jgi:hypothetical protein
MPIPFELKYEPDCLEDFIWPSEDVMETILTFALLKRQDNVFLWGPPGTGKTLLSKLLAQAMLEDDYVDNDTVIDLTAKTEEERNKQLSSLHTKLRQNTFNPCAFRIVIINEIADLKDSSIRLLKTTFDGLKRRTTPVLLFTTANEELDALPVVERVTTVKVDYPPSEALLELGRYILAEEKATGLDDKDIRDCIVASGRSVRMFLRELEEKVMRAQIRKMKVIIGGKYIGLKKPEAKPGDQSSDKPLSRVKAAEQDAQASAKRVDKKKAQAKPGAQRKDKPFSLAKAAEEGQAAAAE